MGIKASVFAASLLAAASVSAEVTREQSFSYELDDNGRVSLENINGNVTVTGHRGNKVEILAVLKGDNEEYLDQIKINVDHSGDAIRIETEHPDKGGMKSWFSWGDDGGGSVTYTVSVPRDANLEDISSVNGNVYISGVSGVVKASTVNGRIEASDLAASAKMETVNGVVEASFTRFADGQKADCESVNGRIVVNLPSDADAMVKAETINGGIDGSDFGLKTNKGFIGRDLEGSIGSGSGRLALSTVNGAIKINSN